MLAQNESGFSAVVAMLGSKIKEKINVTSVDNASENNTYALKQRQAGVNFWACYLLR